MAEEKFEELNNVLLDIIENQKITLKELKYLNDDLKAQNRLLTELIKIQKANEESVNKQMKMLEKLSE